MQPQMTQLEYNGGIIQLSTEGILERWLDDTKSKISGRNDGGIIPPLGEYWHGQGGIYAARMRGNKGRPDRHLIIPVSDSLKFKDVWGKSGKLVTGCDNDLYGYDNTVAMAEAGSEAAKKILAMRIEGHSDYYLFARHEARASFLNVPELFNEETYWTSTQSSAGSAFFQHFDDGSQLNYRKSHELWLRPVRSFVI